ncbi:MAG TPA: hypothetical protein VM674_03365 [Candidatus Acidoferrum sp.]|nr:hypothetical protein [Candidatus Acidoferrum sp.]
MAACPRCGSALVGGSVCEFCVQYGGPQPSGQSWQQPQGTPSAYQPQPQVSQPPAQADRPPIDTGINLLELDWARTRVMWAWLAVGAIGALSIGAYWLITRHPDVVLQTVLALLLDPSKNSSDEQTKMDILQLIVFFVLSWVPLTGWAIHYLLAPPHDVLAAFAQAADISPLMWQGLVYFALAILIWRRSMIALIGATLLFLADSGIYTYGVVRLFAELWDLNQKFQAEFDGSRTLLAHNPYDLQHWPWGLVIPVLVRLAILWLLLTSISAVGVVRLHHQRLKAGKAEAQALAA